MNIKSIFFVLGCLLFFLVACEKEGTVFISPFSKDVPVMGETFQVQITSNKAWTASAKQQWISVSPTSGLGDAVVNVTVEASNSTTSNIAEVVFAISDKSAKLVIKRMGLNATFKVSSAKKVKFSKGNLQYQAATHTWRFAENQYDVIGNDNSNVSSLYTGWIDLFGWGTSGYNDKYPWMTSEMGGDYAEGEKDIAGTQYDWGVYNKISNGGNQIGLWRTLTKDEWNYLVNKRADAADKYSHATVDSVCGLILLPDEWLLPEGLIFVPQSHNIYTQVEWIEMEKYGAIFLPAAGYRYRTGVYGTGFTGNYSSSSYSSSEMGGCYLFNFYGSTLTPTFSSKRYYGLSVRLVQDL